MSREELIKYYENSLKCLSNMENSNCDYDCDKCHIDNKINVFEICKETIRYLKEV